MNNCDRQGKMKYTPCPIMSPVEEETLAMAFVPWQYFHNVYDPDKALMCGTIFPELNLPFMGKRGACKL